MTETPDIPDKVGLNWIARRLVAMQAEVGAARQIGDAAALRRDIQDLRDEARSTREQLDVVVMTTMRLERVQTAMRDEMRVLVDLHRDLRLRVEDIEPGPPAI